MTGRAVRCVTEGLLARSMTHGKRRAPRDSAFQGRPVLLITTVKTTHYSLPPRAIELLTAGYPDDRTCRLFRTNRRERLV